MNVIRVAKFNPYYWVDSDSSRSHTHTHTHTVIHSKLSNTVVVSRRGYPTCELVRWIWRAYLWAIEETVDFQGTTQTLHLQCLCRRQLTAYFWIFPSPLLLQPCCMCKVLPTRFIANRVAKVTLHYESRLEVWKPWILVSSRQKAANSSQCLDAENAQDAWTKVLPGKLNTRKPLYP